jgi:LAGLIDADG DNA endonuclease family
MQQADFVYHLYELFQDFIQSPPNIVDVKDSGKFKSCSNIWVGTLAFACFNFYRELFYIYQADLNKEIKKVPIDIDKYLTNVGLVYR